MPQTYRLREEFFAALTRRAFTQSFLLSVIALAAGIFITAHNTGPLSGSTLTVFVPGMLALMAYGLYSALRRERSAWRSFEIVLERESITRRMSGRPDITLTPHSVTSISEMPNGTLTVRGESLNDTIFVPHQLNGLPEIRAILAQWQTIHSQPARPAAALNLLAVLATLLLMVVAFTSRTPAVGAPASLLLAAGLLWSARTIHRSSHLDKRVRRTAWVILLPVLALLARAYILLFP